ncbi:MAG: hypothetical protein PHW73_00620 [Atribacterota bacterium]|nr:hypothetical protein [Atribacterota bacterium]
MKTYVEKRQIVIDKVCDLVKLLHKNDDLMLSAVIDLTVVLEISETCEEFVNGMLGFINYATSNDVSNEILFGTLLHDLSEFKHNRFQSWFLPRTKRFQKYIDNEIQKSETQK